MERQTTCCGCLACTGECVGENWVGDNGEDSETDEACPAETDPPYWLASLLFRLNDGVVRSENGEENPDT